MYVCYVMHGMGGGGGVCGGWHTGLNKGWKLVLLLFFVGGGGVLSLYTVLDYLLDY